MNSSDECWMLNGPVGLRITRPSKNAQRIAEVSHGHPKLERVIYPGGISGGAGEKAACKKIYIMYYRKTLWHRR